jgi:hypothetical protein
MPDASRPYAKQYAAHMHSSFAFVFRTDTGTLQKDMHACARDLQAKFLLTRSHLNVTAEKHVYR